MSWVFKAPFLVVVLVIFVGIFNNYIDRDYDIRKLEAMVVKDRVEFCVDEWGIDNMMDCFVNATNYAFNVTLVAGGERIMKKDGETITINENLHKHKPLCIFQKRFTCEEGFFARDGAEYNLDLVLENPEAV